MGKKYFQQKKLVDIIFRAPYKDLGVGGPGSKERENAIEEQKLMRASFLDFLLGMLILDPNLRWTPKQALLHPYITGEPFDANIPFKPPLCMETTSEETRKEHQRSAAKMAAAVSEACKERSYRGKETEANRPNAVSRFCSCRRHDNRFPAGLAANAAAVVNEVPSAVSAQQQQPVVGGLAAALASASTQLPPLLEMRTFCRRNKCKRRRRPQAWQRYRKPPGSNDAICFWRWKLWPKSRAEAAVLPGTTSSGSPHAYELCRITSVTLWAITADFANEKFVRAKTARSCGESSRCRSVSSCAR